MKPLFTKVLKIGIAVKDIDEMVKIYSDTYGIGPWSIFEFNHNNVKSMIIDNKELNYKKRVARTNIGDIEIEFIQPLDDLSICSKYIKENGEGLFNITYQVEDFDEAMNFFKERNIGVLEGGNWLGKYKYAYLDSQKELGYIVELNKTEPDFFKKVENKYGNPRIINPVPDKVYPPENKQSEMAKPLLQKILEIAFIVKSVKKTVKTYADLYGIGPWEIWKFNKDSVYDMKINGKRVNYEMRVAELSIGDTFIELIEPLDDISIYGDFLKKHGEGIHHIAYKVEDFNKTIEFFRSKGIEEYQSGNWGGQYIYLYVNSLKDLKHLVELWDIKPGSQWPAPLEIYPKKN